MKRTLVCSFALLLMGLAVPRIATTIGIAEPVYVPVIEVQGADGRPLATRLWISNFDGADRPYSAIFLRSETDGTALPGQGARGVVPAYTAAYLQSLADEGETGLLEIEGGGDLAVSGWLKSARGGRTFYAGVPVITPENRLAAGEAAYLNGVGRDGSRDVTQLALVNLGPTAALCQVDTVEADGALLHAGAAVEVPPLSLRRFEDALGLRGEPAATARISCAQPFYAFAVTADESTSEVAFINPSAVIETATAAITAGRAAGKSAGTTKPTITFSQTGRFHFATKQHPKAILSVPVPRAMAMATVKLEFDFVAGPWNPRYRSGAHNLIFIHRGRFRSSTLANVNALGPRRYLLKMNQNLDLPPKANTKAETGFVFQHGQRYHITVVQDGASRSVTLTLSQNGQVLKSLRFTGSARNGAISVPATGLVAEFGNYDNQGLPEVSSLAFAYENFRVEMTEK